MNAEKTHRPPPQTALLPSPFILHPFPPNPEPRLVRRLVRHSSRSDGGSFGEGGRPPGEVGTLNPAAGQAMAEFCVALVVIMVLLAGMIQANRLLRTHSNAMIEARREAAQLAMGALPAYSLEARTILDWSAGPDQKPYTSDDVPLSTTNTAGQADALTRYAHPSELASFVPLNPVSQLSLAGDPIVSFALVRGYAEETVPVLPALRKLVYAGDSIPVDSEAYLAWTKGLY